MYVIFGRIFVKSNRNEQTKRKIIMEKPKI
jgi:hypothetical protein